ncbi:unnamed protein product [Owenia fusiformis]|uniref:Uncharacterized protein n=1 Tax=Owenia fusiformis TaxID=6347 RepID=A0A8J1TI98_OWEFU|nr:unnamed protein product [Owenia fusiformis]
MKCFIAILTIFTVFTYTCYAQETTEDPGQNTQAPATSNPFTSFDIVAMLAYCSTDAECETALGTGATCVKAHDTCTDSTKFCSCGEGKTLYNGACVTVVTNGGACQGTSNWNMTDCDSAKGLSCGSDSQCECSDSTKTFKADIKGVSRCLKAKKTEACTTNSDCGGFLECESDVCVCPAAYFEDSTDEYGCVAGHVDDKCAGSNANKTCNAGLGYTCDGSTSESKCTCQSGKFDQTLTVALGHGFTGKARACVGTEAVSGSCRVDYSSNDGTGSRGCSSTETCNLCPPASGSRVAEGTCVSDDNGGGGESGAGSIRINVATVAIATTLAALAIVTKV